MIVNLLMTKFVLHFVEWFFLLFFKKRLGCSYTVVLQYMIEGDNNLSLHLLKLSAVFLDT